MFQFVIVVVIVELPIVTLLICNISVSMCFEWYMMLGPRFWPNFFIEAVRNQISDRLLRGPRPNVLISGPNHFVSKTLSLLNLVWVLLILNIVRRDLVVLTDVNIVYKLSLVWVPKQLRIYVSEKVWSGIVDHLVQDTT
jgi:hypothetical protein